MASQTSNKPFVPYFYIQCPCCDTASQSPRAADSSSPRPDRVPEEYDHTFDPRAPRSNYSLYPIEYLLYCDVCHQIRCPRCVLEELVTIYCPSCLFEVGASSVKTEGNRCTRSCFQCPICAGPLAVQSLDSAPEPSLLTPEKPKAMAPSGPWALACSYCNWCSSEINVKFDKPQGIFSQLSKLHNGYGDEHYKHAQPAVADASAETPATNYVTEEESGSVKARFSRLKAFYGSQIASSDPSSGLGAAAVTDYGYGSPATLTRIMNLYAGSAIAPHKPKGRPAVMREADRADEGFKASDLDETASILAIRRAGYDGTATLAQAGNQVQEGARFVDDLWPIPALLRTKRAKRCHVCRHILSKPEQKVSNTRWRIRLTASLSVPSIEIKPLIPFGAAGASASGLLTPVQPVQYLLTFRNPAFEAIKVTLATPATTPGRFESRVTVLCPEFEIGANSDDYNIDEVLQEEGADAQAKSAGEDMPQPDDTGKPWERGRNWVTIVVEVIPASLALTPKPVILRREGETEDLSPLKEDDDILEIPMFVRLEWEGDVPDDKVGTAPGKEKEGREKKELAYWTVLGIGRISRD